MGAQIAAHLANAGVEVLLLDLAAPEGQEPLALVKKRLKAVTKLKPNPFFTKVAHGRISCGTIEHDLEKIANVEWIVEAVIERLDIKRALLEQVEMHASPGSIVSTNTSGIPIHALVAGRSMEFRQHFLGTHFFNPPRYLSLLEVIAHADTSPYVLDKIGWYARIHLGKDVVQANDVPYFIANRIGIYGMSGVIEQFTSGAYTIEEIDTLTGPLVGRPKSGTFRTADVVGLDVMQLVCKNLYESVPEDESRARFRVPEILNKLVAKGALGAKSGAGFYRKEGRKIRSLNLSSGQYEDPAPLDLGDLGRIKAAGALRHRLVALFEDQGRAGEFFRKTMLDGMAYAARRIGEITDSPARVDRGMCSGFGWKMGPFETWDAIGFARVREAMVQDGITLPEWVLDMPDDASFYVDRPLRVYFPSRGEYVAEDRPADERSLASIKLDSGKDLWSNKESGLIDLGDGVALFEFRSKACTLGFNVINGLFAAVDYIENDPNLHGLVIGNEGSHFSVGANLAEMAGAVQSGDFGKIDQYIARFQSAMQRVHYARKPVVVAAHQRALGGGCELIMACPNPVAAAETYAGLVELGVGLIPAGTGSMRFAAKAGKENQGYYDSNLLPGVMKYFETVAKATVSMGAEEARDLGFLPDHACIVMNSARRFHVAKHEVLRLSNQGYCPPVRPQIRVLGRPGAAALATAVYQLHQGRFISDYDLYLAKKLAHVFTGGDLSGAQEVSESYLLDLEREVFLGLLGQPKTQERIAGLLETNRPIRN